MVASLFGNLEKGQTWGLSLKFFAGAQTKQLYGTQIKMISICFQCFKTIFACICKIRRSDIQVRFALYYKEFFK